MGADPDAPPGPDEAATDPDIDSVAVVAHVPVHDSSPQQASQLGDRLEAAVVERWLTGFETDSGKESVYIGAHAGYFAADHVDGVAYWVNGNSGKAPHGTPEDGGFVGWTEFGVTESRRAASSGSRPRSGRRWTR